jgi:hypothetical protein
MIQMGTSTIRIFIICGDLPFARRLGNFAVSLTRHSVLSFILAPASLTQLFFFLFSSVAAMPLNTIT